MRWEQKAEIRDYNFVFFLQQMPSTLLNMLVTRREKDELLFLKFSTTSKQVGIYVFISEKCDDIARV